MENVYGIDLGTTYSCIAKVEEGGDGKATVFMNHEGELTTPSVVYFESDSNVVVGQVAKDSTEMEPEKTVAFVKRHIGKGDGFSFNYNGDELKPEAISAFVLRKLAKDAESQTGEKVENVVITHPAYFGQNEIQATKDAGTIAGLNVVALMPEPVAAAYAYGLSSPENYGKTILVYDLGGGTFDATLVKIDEKEIRVITTGGDANLGGYNWDERLIDLIVDKICDQTSADRDELMEDPETRAFLQNKAETIKIALSNTESQRLQLRLPVGNVKDNVTIEEFESATQDLCDRTILLTKDMLEQAKGKLGVDNIEISQILLVGGSTMMRQIPVAVRNEFGIEPLVFDPNQAVAKGAALYGAAVGNYPDPVPDPVPDPNPDPDQDISEISGRTIKIVMVTSKSFGVAAYVGDEKKIKTIIKKQMDLPAHQMQKFVTREDNMVEAELVFYETESDEDSVELDFGRELGTAILGLPGDLPAGSPIEIQITVNDEGLLSFEGRDCTNGGVVTGVFEVKDGLTQRQVNELREKHKDLVVE